MLKVSGVWLHLSAQEAAVAWRHLEALSVGDLGQPGSVSADTYAALPMLPHLTSLVLMGRAGAASAEQQEVLVAGCRHLAHLHLDPCSVALLPQMSPTLTFLHLGVAVGMLLALGGTSSARCLPLQSAAPECVGSWPCTA